MKSFNTMIQKDSKVVFTLEVIMDHMLFLLAFEGFCRNNYFIYSLTSLRLVSVTYYYPHFSDEDIGSPSAIFSSTALFFNTTRNLMNGLQKIEFEATFPAKECKSSNFQYIFKIG